MSKKEAPAFLVVVFPESMTPIATLATDMLQALTKSCGEAPTLVHPDKNKLAMLVTGGQEAIVKTLQGICQKNNDSWLLLPIGMPCVANGLSRAEGWIRSHSLPPQK